MAPTSAREWLDLVLEDWSLLFEEIVSDDPLGFPGYAEQLRAAREKTGCTEAVLVAEGRIEGSRRIVISFEFGFLGGSMGVAAGERICRAFERGADEQIPVVALTASGGARMQEGMLALSQMPATLIARQRLATNHMPFVCYLRNPTTGGVYASFASSADLLWAEPRATIGFAGPRVAETVTGVALPADAHTAESAFDACLVDALVEPSDLRARLITALTDSEDRAQSKTPSMPTEPRPSKVHTWTRVQLSRHEKRPTGSDLVEIFEPLRRGGCDQTVITGLTRFGLRPALVIAQNRHAMNGRTTPGGYERVRRAIAFADRFGAPIVTLIDTPGADPSDESEREGIAGEISATFLRLLAARGPTIGIVVGEGGSGGALALAACDKLLMLENSIFSVIGPEAAAMILRRNDIPSIAGDLKLTAHDVLKLGIADRVLPEPENGAHLDHKATRIIVNNAIQATLKTLGPGPSKRRFERWRAHR